MASDPPGTGAGVGDPAARGTGRARVRVALASDQPLVAEAVRAALASHRFDVRPVEWPRGPVLEHQLAGLRPRAGLVIYEVDTALRLAAAGELLRAWPVPWLVLTGSGPGPAYGGLLAAGAAGVCPNAVGLDEVDRLLHRLVQGKPAISAHARERQIAEWAAVRYRPELQARLDRLTRRERDTLGLMLRGWSTRQVASALGLSQTTVRSHVRGILGKLDVRNQLAAVALVRSLDDIAEPVAG